MSLIKHHRNDKKIVRIVVIALALSASRFSVKCSWKCLMWSNLKVFVESTIYTISESVSHHPTTECGACDTGIKFVHQNEKASPLKLLFFHQIHHHNSCLIQCSALLCMCQPVEQCKVWITKAFKSDKSLYGPFSKRGGWKFP